MSQSHTKLGDQATADISHKGHTWNVAKCNFIYQYQHVKLSRWSTLR